MNDDQSVPHDPSVETGTTISKSVIYTVSPKVATSSRHVSRRIECTLLYLKLGPPPTLTDVAESHRIYDELQSWWDDPKDGGKIHYARQCIGHRFEQESRSIEYLDSNSPPSTNHDYVRAHEDALSITGDLYREVNDIVRDVQEEQAIEIGVDVCNPFVVERYQEGGYEVFEVKSVEESSLSDREVGRGGYEHESR